MRHRVFYWLIGLGLACIAGFLYWQQRQEQRQTQAQMRLLDATLQVANERAEADAGKILQDIQQAIRHNQNQPRDLSVLHQTENLRYRANQATEAIRKLRRDLVPGKAMANPERRTTANEQAEREVDSFISYVKQIMVTPSFAGPGFDSKYSRPMEQFLNPVDERIARLHKFTAVQEHSKVFCQHYPLLPTALALLTQKEAVIREYELMGLAFQNQKIGCFNIVFDKVGVFAIAESNTVSAGETYKAEMFLTLSNTKPASQMTVNGEPIAIGPDGHGRVEFRVSSAAAKAQAAQAYWTGTVRTLVNGRDSIFKVVVPYTIRPN